MLNNREGPQAREPSKCLNGRSYRERMAKEAFWLPATRGSKKDSGKAITPAEEAVRVPTHLAPSESLQAKQLHHLHPQFSLEQSCHRQKKILASRHEGLLWSCPTLCDPVDCDLPGFSQGAEFTRQEYKSILANTGSLTLLLLLLSCFSWVRLDPYISCSPSRQLPWVPGAARTPVTQAAAPPPFLTLTGANPSPPGQPQEQIPVDDPHTKLKIKQ